MRIAVVAPFAEGVLKFRGPLLREMRRRGHEVEVLLPPPPAEVAAGLEAMGVAARIVPLGRASMNPLRDLAALAALRREMRRFRPDLVFSYNPKGVIYGTLAAWLAGVPRRFAMVTGLGFAFTTRSARSGVARTAASLLYRLAVPRATGLLFQNPSDREVFAERGLLPKGVPVEVVPGTGVDAESFPPAPIPAPTSFLMIARLLRDKGVVEYAEACRAVRDRLGEVRCRLAGWLDVNPSAVSETELAGWIESGRLEFLGRLSDVRPAMREASVFVLPSYREGFSMVLLEAMSMGRAIITTDAPGCRDLVRHGREGLLVPPRDAAALAAAMLELAGDPARVAAMGAAARRRVEEEFDSRAVCGRLLDRMGA